MPRSEWEEELWEQMTSDGPGIPWPQRELVFAKPRRWRFDFAWEHLLLAVEVQGGRWSKSTHSGGAWQTKSFEKTNEAALRGWKILQVNAEMIEDGTAIALIKRALEVLDND